MFRMGYDYDGKARSIMLASVLSIWPSGPRRRTQVAVVTTAWVRTPQLTMEVIFPCFIGSLRDFPLLVRGDLCGCVFRMGYDYG